MIKEIKSRHNPLVKEIRAAFRSGRLSEGRLLPFEGPLLLAEAFKSRARVDSLLVEDVSLLNPKLLDWLNGQLTRVFRVSHDLISSIAETETPAGLVGLAQVPRWDPERLLSQKTGIFLVLVGIQDPGNMGTIIRTAEAFGVTAVWVTTKTVSPFNPKAVRASAGSIFRTPVVPGCNEVQLHEKLRKYGITTVATSVKAQHSIETFPIRLPVALWIGQEAAGLPKSLISACQNQVRIPMCESVQSLNVAIATGILLYEIRKHEQND